MTRIFGSITSHCPQYSDQKYRRGSPVVLPTTSKDLLPPPLSHEDRLPRRTRLRTITPVRPHKPLSVRGRDWGAQDSKVNPVYHEKGQTKDMSDEYFDKVARCGR